MLRRFPRGKCGARGRDRALEKLQTTNLELTDKVMTLTGELAAAKRREAELRRTINEQNAQIERLGKERAPASGGRPSDDEGYILTPPDLHDRLRAEFGVTTRKCSECTTSGTLSELRPPEEIAAAAAL
jgi:hypothetical protein